MEKSELAMFPELEEALEDVKKSSSLTQLQSALAFVDEILWSEEADEHEGDSDWADDMWAKYVKGLIPSFTVNNPFPSELDDGLFASADDTHYLAYYSSAGPSGWFINEREDLMNMEVAKGKIYEWYPEKVEAADESTFDVYTIVTRMEDAKAFKYFSPAEIMRRPILVQVDDVDDEGHLAVQVVYGADIRMYNFKKGASFPIDYTRGGWTVLGTNLQIVASSDQLVPLPDFTIDELKELYSVLSKKFKYLKVDFDKEDIYTIIHKIKTVGMLTEDHPESEGYEGHTLELFGKLGILDEWKVKWIRQNYPNLNLVATPYRDGSHGGAYREYLNMENEIVGVETVEFTFDDLEDIMHCIDKHMEADDRRSMFVYISHALYRMKGLQFKGRTPLIDEFPHPCSACQDFECYWSHVANSGREGVMSREEWDKFQETGKAPAWYCDGEYTQDDEE